MSKLYSLKMIANIEIVNGMLSPVESVTEAMNSKKYQTIKGPKGSMPGMLRRPSRKEMDNYFRKAGLTEGYTKYNEKHIHWCGIFQTYLLNMVGVRCHWNREIVDDSGGTDLEIVKGKAAQKDLAVGDIVRIHHEEHHFMVITPTKTGFLRSLEGNAGGIKHPPLLAANWMGNMRHNIVEDVYIRYRVIS